MVRDDKAAPKQIWDGLLKSLTEQEAEVIRPRFDLGIDAPLTIAQVARKLHLTRERVRIIEAKARAKLERAIPRNNERPLKRCR